MASEIKVDTISEKTSANGVTIDGVSLKDSKIATANSVDSDAYVDGSIDAVHLSANSVDSDAYVDGSIDEVHMSANSIDSDSYVDASIDNAHLADNAVDTAEIADNAVTLDKMAGLARGTLIYGDASGDPAALAAGGADEVLTHDGTDLSWAAAGGGKVLAYESTLTTGTYSNTNSTSFSSMQTDTITPSSSDSKILVIWSGWTYVDNNNAAVTSCHGVLEVSKNHSGISETALYRVPFGQGFPEDSGMDWQTYANQTIAFVDSPATTNEVTYSLNAQVGAATSILYIADGSNSRAFTLLELA